MEPNHQLFGHYLRYRTEMQQAKYEQHDENTSGYMKATGIRAAIGKSLKHLVNYYRHLARGRGTRAFFRKRRT
jgi:hypothetical protein